MAEFLKIWEAPREFTADIKELGRPENFRKRTASKSDKTYLLNTTVSYLNTNWNFTAKSRDSRVFHSKCVAQFDIFAPTASPTGPWVAGDACAIVFQLCPFWRLYHAGSDRGRVEGAGGAPPLTETLFFVRLLHQSLTPFLSSAPLIR